MGGVSKVVLLHEGMVYIKDEPRVKAVILASMRATSALFAVLSTSLGPTVPRFTCYLLFNVCKNYGSQRSSRRLILFPTAC